MDRRSRPGVMRAAVRRAWLPGLLLLGLVLLALDLQSRADEVDRFSWPPAGVLIAVVAAALTGQLAFGLAWDRLVAGVDDHRGLAWSFHGSQPAKYVPIGIAQTVGQVALVRRLGVPGAVATVTWVVQIVTFVVAGLVLGAGLAFSPDGALSVLSPLGFLSVVLVVRPVLVRVLTRVSRWHERVPTADAIPSQRAVLEGLGVALLAVGLHATAFALLVGESAQAVPAYAFAFGVSTATPLPAGLGIREALLVAVTDAPAADVLGAALVLRVILLGVELVLFAASYALFAATTSATPSSPEPG